MWSPGVENGIGPVPRGVISRFLSDEELVESVIVGYGNSCGAECWSL